MTCAEALRVQAYFDAELAPDDAASIERHLPRCPGCRTLLAELEQTRATLKNVPQLRAPAALRANIFAALDVEEVAAAQAAPAKPTRGASIRTRPFWIGAFAGLGVSVLAAALFAFVMLPFAAGPTVDGLLTAHLQSLEPQRLVAVVSSEHHTVKPWFGGHADVSPTVADFSARGFTLVGGRADPLLGQRAAVTVYRHGKHVINVFAWSNKNTVLPEATTRNGYRLLFWRSADLAYCAVSDTTWNAMEELRGLIEAQIVAEQRVEISKGLDETE